MYTQNRCISTLTQTSSYGQTLISPTAKYMYWTQVIKAALFSWYIATFPRCDRVTYIYSSEQILKNKLVDFRLYATCSFFLLEI